MSAFQECEFERFHHLAKYQPHVIGVGLNEPAEGLSPIMKVDSVLETNLVIA